MHYLGSADPDCRIDCRAENPALCRLARLHNQLDKLRRKFIFADEFKFRLGDDRFRQIKRIVLLGCILAGVEPLYC